MALAMVNKAVVGSSSEQFAEVVGTIVQILLYCA